ncbi:MAG: ABC transporter [Thermodesulfovibrio sp.]|nr:ABC transporter [Thermodesulfovibrio sp.]
MSSACKHAILDMQGVSFSYTGAAPFVKDLGLTVCEGEFIGLLGANGSGKSTILKLGSGILKPAAGSVSLWGKPLRAYANKDRAKLISYLPQTIDISVPFTVAEVVGMGLYPYDVRPSMTVAEALTLVGLEDKRNSYLSDLSGGEQRRVFIAMTLLQGAGLLLLDEPLANLDIRYQVEIVRLLKQLNKERSISVVIALHDINIALQFEKVVLIQPGSILGVGTPEEILTEERIRHAFGVDVKIIRQPGGKAYISYESNFSRPDKEPGTPVAG